MSELRRLFDRRKIRQTYHTIEREQVESILTEHLPAHTAFLLYRKYKIPKLEELKDAISSTIVEEARNKCDEYDCENFALHLHSVMTMEYDCNACGVVVSRASNNVFNIFLARDHGIYQVYNYKSHKNTLSQVKKTELPDYVIEGQTIVL